MCYCHWVLSHSSLLRIDDVMGIDLVRHLVMDYVGMINWEHVHSARIFITILVVRFLMLAIIIIIIVILSSLSSPEISPPALDIDWAIAIADDGKGLVFSLIWLLLHLIGELR